MTRFYYKSIELIVTDIWSITELKNQLRITHNIDDDLLKNMLSAAINSAEQFLRLAINKRRIEMIFYQIDRAEITVPYLPIFEINNITLVGSDHNLTLEQNNGYFLHGSQIVLNGIRSVEKLALEYTTGFKELPAAIKQGIMLHAEEMYDRQEWNVGLPEAIKSLYQPFRNIKV